MLQWFQAAATNNSQYIEQNIETYQNAVDQYGRTALMIAALRRSNKVVQQLAEAESKVQTKEGFTALMIAAGCQNEKAVSILAPYEAGIVSKQNVSALMCAASVGATDTFKALKSELGLQNSKGQTALMIAAAQGYDECVEQLKKKEYKISDATNKNAMMYAASSGKFQIIEQLLKNYTFKSTDQKGWTALRYAFSALDNLNDIQDDEVAQGFAQSCLKCIQLLMNEEKDYRNENDQLTTLMLCAIYGGVSMIPALQSQFKVQDTDGNTALMHAARLGQIEVLTALLPHEQKLTNDKGMTALMVAAENSQFDAVKLLFDAEKSILDKEQNTPLHYAALSGDEEIINFLLPHYIGKQNINGVTALMNYIQKGHVNFAKFADEFSIYTKAGLTPLMVAAQSDAPLESFISQKNLRDDSDWNATIHAAAHDSLQAFRQLIFIESQKYKSQPQPIFVAAELGSVKILKLISDGSRMSRSDYLNLELQSKEQRILQSFLKAKTKNLVKYPDGLNALEIAVQVQNSNAVRILGYCIQERDENGITPLMMMCQFDCALDKQAIKVMVERFAGQALKKDYAGLPQGATALMIAAGMNVENTQIIEKLAKYEKDYLDSKGQKAIDYAKGSDRTELFTLLQ
ncbi:Ankyrin_repeat-containing protein [Hexamita inflata]|uniref:Ankyrin repeat-containing protein n=1 Tax=Hexamita inflata TaxID=28002 RepID=A0AA86PST8_9EUKA|nr:Ankyrin repeat-containing protein [Hexamita inflata]